MQQYMCICLKCKSNEQFNFDEPYPKYGDEFVRLCRYCQEDTPHTMALTKRIASQLRAEKEELELKETIIKYCESYGFTCRFLYRSVIITTSISSWQFDYHSTRKTLRHESTVKINLKTGNYAKTHEQFRNRKMSCEDVIDYIAKHDKWRQEQIKK